MPLKYLLMYTFICAVYNLDETWEGANAFFQTIKTGRRKRIESTL